MRRKDYTKYLICPDGIKSARALTAAVLQLQILNDGNVFTLLRAVQPALHRNPHPFTSSFIHTPSTLAAQPDARLPGHVGPQLHSGSQLSSHVYGQKEESDYTGQGRRSS